jgi:hypothetical protein
MVMIGLYSKPNTGIVISDFYSLLQKWMNEKDLWEFETMCFYFILIKEAKFWIQHITGQRFPDCERKSYRSSQRGGHGFSPGADEIPTML